ncbi:MAG: MerR family transcriptional regulator [Bacteroidia bacterium]
MSPAIDLDKASEKLYYPIGEVAEMFGVNTSLIRFWEKEFAILKPHKNKKGNRLFTQEDLINLKLIFHLVKEKGYTLEGARKILESDRKNAEIKIQLRDTLMHMKSFLEDLKEQL